MFDDRLSDRTRVAHWGRQIGLYPTPSLAKVIKENGGYDVTYVSGALMFAPGGTNHLGRPSETEISSGYKAKLTFDVAGHLDFAGLPRFSVDDADVAMFDDGYFAIHLPRNRALPWPRTRWGRIAEDDAVDELLFRLRDCDGDRYLAEGVVRDVPDAARKAISRESWKRALVMAGF